MKYTNIEALQRAIKRAERKYNKTNGARQAAALYKEEASSYQPFSAKEGT